VFIVGLGTGNTASAFLAHPDTEVEAAELSREVVAGAREMLVGVDYFHDPRFRLVLADGRQELQRRSDRFDVILSGTRSHLYMSGTLYSADYWRICAARLTENGLHAQWLPGTSPAHDRLLIRTFLSVYPEVSAWDFGSSVMLLGSRRPLTIDNDRLTARLHEPSRRSALGAAGLNDPVDVYRHFLGDTAALRGLAGPGPITTDDRPLTEFMHATGAPLGGSVRQQLAGHRVSVLAHVVGLIDSQRHQLTEALRN
jgi:hypothetical protein